MAKQTMPVCDLIEDMAVYPRHAIDNTHVANLALAITSGVTLPPIVAQDKTKRLVDGWHRARAYRRVHGPNHPVQVELVQYKTEADLLLDAVARNSSHGRRLDHIDQARCAIMLERVGVETLKIAAALHVTTARVEQLTVRVAKAPAESSHTVTGSQVVALKRGAAHLAGRKLTKEQVAAHGSLPGTSLTLTARQLEKALRAGLVDLTDDRLLDALRDLHSALCECLP